MCLDTITFLLLLLMYGLVLILPFIVLYFIIYFWLKRRNEAREEMNGSHLRIY
jgi:preprotein translocase subunit YajC